MNNLKQTFIQFCLEKKILQFGNFTLKSGKKSTFFFNFSLFNTGRDLEKLGFFYAKKIVEQNINCDMLFGIAYKGIPIVISTVIALQKHFNINAKYCFNRKEIKNHGEKGIFIGNKLKNNFILLDDVITTGSSICDIISLIQSHSSSKNIVSNILVALNRKIDKNEVLNKEKTKQNFKIISIIHIKDIINYIKSKKNLIHYLKNIEQDNL
ncbi:MAG: orotate phosphoribosyltransferase [Buchnera aphidicola (Schlechtendalia chinensis)]